jgi:farnesyl-diphosphate farnesyltransferase
MTASQNELLRANSRSFYLTLRVLPAAIRSQIGLAYLLARTADTIADTEIVPLARRLEALQKFRERILDKSAAQVNFSDLAGRQGAPEEKLLLEKAGDSLDAVQKFSESDQKLIRTVLVTIISGQELDLKRFAPKESAYMQVIALESPRDLDDYTYRVAGCVGEFWSKLCRAHLFPGVRMDESQFMINAVRFGKGLQLTNILRDVPADYKKGRCYLPAEKLEQAKLSPQTMLSEIHEQKFLPLFHEYLDKAEDNLRAGWEYTNTLPFSQFRLRLACAWPVLIGMKTIEKLRRARLIDLKQNLKIPRPEVKRIMFCSLLACPIPPVWVKLLPQKQLH